MKVKQDFYYNMKVFGGEDKIITFHKGDEITDEVLLNRLLRFNPECLDIKLNNARQIIQDKIEEPKIKEMVKVIEEEKKKPKTKKEFEALNKNEQIELLQKYGFGDDEIKFLRKESDRVNKLLELQKQKGVI